MLCVGIGRRMLDDGKKVGYLKLSLASEADAQKESADAVFMKEALSLQEPVDTIFVAAGKDELPGRAMQALDRISAGKDVVIVEGVNDGDSASVAERLNAKVLVVADYAAGVGVAPEVSGMSGLLGLVLNKVPLKKAEKVSTEMSAALKSVGVSLLGVIPEDRLLMAQTVAELSEAVNGRILSSEDQSGELVENVMLGAMTVDHGPYYYGRKNNKAVVVRGGRPDMQMAALQTSTACIVLDKDAEPVNEVSSEAEKKGIPVISAGGSVQELANSIEASFSSAKFNQLKKLPRLSGILNKSLNFTEMYKSVV